MNHKDKYIAIQGHECLSACLAGILNPINHEINSSAIITLGAGMEITYNTSEDVISSNMYNANYNFLNRYHICYECNTIAIDATYESIDQTFCELLNENVLPIIKLNPANLTYHRVFAQAQSSIHYICLTGYEDDSYYILDNYVPSYIVTTFEGKVKKEYIIKAFIH